MRIELVNNEPESKIDVVRCPVSENGSLPFLFSQILRRRSGTAAISLMMFESILYQVRQLCESMAPDKSNEDPVSSMTQLTSLSMNKPTKDVNNVTKELQVALGNTYVIIPMLNEEDSIALVIGDLPTVAEVIVVDNGSIDQGASVAVAAGATVVSEPQRGYGKACLTGIAQVAQRVGENGDSAIVVFVDGDYSDHPEELITLIQPIVEEDYEFVVGSRATGKREKGAMHFQAVFGNWLACTLMRWMMGARFTDLGPFRAIRYRSLVGLNMQDENFGWTIEMQIKSCHQKLRVKEVPVSYRCRIGVSKISGTVSGTFRAGYKILYTLFKYRHCPQSHFES